MEANRNDILTVATMWLAASSLATLGMLAIDWWLI